MYEVEESGRPTARTLDLATSIDTIGNATAALVCVPVIGFGFGLLGPLMVPPLPVLLILTCPRAVRWHEQRIDNLVNRGLISAAEGRRQKTRIHNLVTRTFVPGYEEPEPGPKVTVQQ
jgi:hypothetical protein